MYYRRVLILLVALLTVTTFCISQEIRTTPYSTAEIAKLTRPSVAAIVTRNSQNIDEVIGSGFFVREDVIVTNFHVIEAFQEGYVKLAGSQERLKILGVIASDSTNDLALIRLEKKIGRPLPLAVNDSIAVGDEVFVIGNSENLNGSISQGTVSQIGEFEGKKLLQITASILPDSSGGAVLNNKSQVVGVALRYLKEEQVFNFAVPVSFLRSLLLQAEKLETSRPVTARQPPARQTTKEQKIEPSSPSVSDGQMSLASRSVTEFDVNGLKVLLKKRTSAPTVAAGLFIRGGTRNYDEKTSGIENLMLAAATEAGKKYSKETVRRELSRTGSGITGAAGSDYSAISLVSTKQNFGTVWDIFSDVVINPAFSPADVDRVRQQIISGLREAEINPDNALDELEDRVIYAGHPYARDASGTIPTLSAITVDQLRAYHQSVMQTSRLLLVVVGDFDEAELKARVAATFGKLPRGTYKDEAFQPLDFSKPTLDIVPRTLQTNYIKGIFDAPPLNSPDYYPMRVATSILGELVFEEVRRKRQLSYSPDAGLNTDAANTGYIYVTAVDANQAVQVMLKIIKDLKTKPVEDDHIAGMAGQFLTNYYLKQETSAAQVGDLARYELIGGGWKNSFEFLNRIREVKSSDVQTAANKYMKNLRFVVVGNPQAIDRSVFLQN